MSSILRGPASTAARPAMNMMGWQYLRAEADCDSWILLAYCQYWGWFVSIDDSTISLSIDVRMIVGLLSVIIDDSWLPSVVTGELDCAFNQCCFRAKIATKTFGDVLSIPQSPCPSFGLIDEVLMKHWKTEYNINSNLNHKFGQKICPKNS